jgi:Fe-S-cluster-containing dehydrogenase component/CRP-like cAMP-binding protein
MPKERNHEELISAITNSAIFSELVEQREGRLLHELDLEVIVFGRHYAGGKQAGPYARLLVCDPGEEIIEEGKPSRNNFYVLISGKLDVFIKGKSNKEKTTIEPSAPIFGAMSLLSGQPSNATVKVSPETKAEILEIGRPALRLLRKFSTFNREFDRNHSRHALWRTMVKLEEVIGKPFSDALNAELEEEAQFKVYADGHLLFKEGDPIEKLIFIRRGWIQRARGLDPHSPLSPVRASLPELASTLSEKDNVGLDFLGEGNWLGLEILSRETWDYTATIMARTEVLEIDISHLSADRELVDMIKTEFPEFSHADDAPPERPLNIRTTQAAAIEIHEGIVDGTNLLVMDMNLCVRCGNCSMACHKVHGQSRLMRHGIHIARPVKPKDEPIQSVLAPSVCLHCHDAECLIGCPTGAIRRFEDGQIDIEAKTCIGCGDCATHCPYDAISMIERKSLNSPAPGPLGSLKDWISLWPQPAPLAVTAESKDLLAVKCNLCSDRETLNPKDAQTQKYSCEENCPTGALVRVNPQEYFSEAGNAIGISFRDSTHALGRNIHQEDPTADRFHRAGWLLIAAVTSTLLWGAYRYTMDGHLFGTWLTMRWITGALGFFTLLGVMSYLIRKQIYKRRAGPLRYWKLAHVYLGVLAGIVFLIHGGRDSGGLLTSLLMVSFDLTIVAGLIGIICYHYVPRIMTDIEEEPLLVEDLQARREELRDTLGLIDTSDERLRYLIKKKMRRRFFSLTYLIRQYRKREKLSKMLDKAWEEFQADGQALDNPALCESLKTAVRTTATLRRIDALIYLHRLLKLWVAPHVVSASLMLGLMVVHIIQVILFTVR